LNGFAEVGSSRHKQNQDIEFAEEFSGEITLGPTAVKKFIWAAALTAILALESASLADTLTNRFTDEVLHGYATSQNRKGKTVVHTQEKGLVSLNLVDWRIIPNRLGRNNKVIVLMVDDQIMSEIETRAFENSIATASDEGPLFIVVEIDTPGGRIDFAQRICSAISNTRNCRVIAYINGGNYGGALSAGAAIALACDKIYMANRTTIGAASTMAATEDGPKDIKEEYGEELGEKVNSFWRAYLAALAEQNARPVVLAKAMVDRDIEAVEVSDAGKRLFIDPVNKTPKQQMVRTWSKKGFLLTMTTEEAVKSGIADKIANSREELLRDLGAADAQLVVNDAIQKARRELKRARMKFDRVRQDIDLKVKQVRNRQSPQKLLRILREAKTDYKTLIYLGKRYPDLAVNVQYLEEQLNSVEALYQKAKMNLQRK